MICLPKSNCDRFVSSICSFFGCASVNPFADVYEVDAVARGDGSVPFLYGRLHQRSHKALPERSSYLMFGRRFEFLPEGMLPMCYPADHNDGVFIPNWALWFVVQLEEYAQRNGDRDMVDAVFVQFVEHVCSGPVTQCTVSSFGSGPTLPRVHRWIRN